MHQNACSWLLHRCDLSPRKTTNYRLVAGGANPCLAKQPLLGMRDADGGISEEKEANPLNLMEIKDNHSQ